MNRFQVSGVRFQDREGVKFQVSAILKLRNCEFRNLGIIGILSIKFTDTRIPQFLNPLIPKLLNT